MTLTKSYSKDSRFFSMYKAALKNQLPFAVISGILFLIIFIVVFFASSISQRPELFTSEIFGNGAQGFYREYFSDNGVYVDIAQSSVAMAFLGLLTFCSALFGLSYLHSKKTVDLYHSLPVTRPHLLTANALASLTAVLVPFFAMYGLLMAIQLAGFSRYGCFTPAYFQFILYDVLTMVVYCLALYLFIALIAVNVGTVFDSFAVTMAIGFTPMAVYLISGLIWSVMTYGASFDPEAHVILCLSPFTFMFTRYTDLYITYGSPANTYDYPGLYLFLLFGLIAAAALFALTLICYRRRKSEIAGQTQSQGVLQIIVKCVAAFIGAAAFFGIFYGTNIVLRLVAVLFGSLVIGLIAELILSRGVKALKKSILWLVGAGGVYCILILCVYFDVFGYVNRVPRAANIDSVSVSYQGRFQDLSDSVYWYDDNNRAGKLLTSQESIGIVLNMHKLAVENLPPQYRDSMFGYGYADNNYEYNYNSIRLEYKLKNGMKMTRYYQGQIYNLAYRALADLEDKDDFIAANSVLFQMENSPEKQEKFIDSIEFYGSISNPNDASKSRSAISDWRSLVDALKTDMLNESLSEIHNPSQQALGYIAINYKSEYDSGYNLQRLYYGSPRETILITPEYKNTLALLRQWHMENELDSDLSKVRSIEITPLWDSPYDYDANRVRTILPWNDGSYATRYREYSYANENDKSLYDESPVTDNDTLLASSESQPDIAAVANAGVSRMLFTGSQQMRREYVVACFVYDDLGSCLKLVRVDALPLTLRDKVKSKLETNYYEFYEATDEIYPQEVSVVEVNPPAVSEAMAVEMLLG